MCADPAPQGPAFERVMGSRRAWRRVGKRAVAAYERDVSELARRVAGAAPPVLAAAIRPLRGAGEAAVVSLCVTLPGWELELAGVAARAAAGCNGPGAPLRLTRTGRYGAFWWIELAGRPEPIVLLGSGLALSATGEGAGGPAPAAPRPRTAAGLG